MNLKSFFILLLSVITTEMHAQFENRTTVSSPNAGNLGLFGQIPVDYFNGLPQIEIPIYDFSSPHSLFKRQCVQAKRTVRCYG